MIEERCLPIRRCVTTFTPDLRDRVRYRQLPAVDVTMTGFTFGLEWDVAETRNIDCACVSAMAGRTAGRCVFPGQRKPGTIMQEMNDRPRRLRVAPLTA